MSTHDENQDERAKTFDPTSESSMAADDPGKFTQIFFQHNLSSKTPASTNPTDPENGISGNQLGDSQPDQRLVKPATGDFTRIFGKALAQPPLNKSAFNPQAEPSSAPPSFPEPREAAPPQSGSFTRVFGKSTNQLPGQPGASSSPPFIQPESFSPVPPRQSMNPILPPEKEFSQSSSPIRGPFEERIGPAKPDGFSDIFQNPRQAPPKFQGLGAPMMPAAAIPTGTQPSASTPVRRPSDDLFVDDKPSLNAAKLPGGPSEYSRVVNASAARPSQESNSTAPPATASPQANASQAQPAYQMPMLVQMPQMPSIPQPQMQVPQMMPTAPMVQMPAIAPLPQPSLQVAPQAQPLPQNGGSSKWASYMPLIIALNIFLLLAMFLILIVFLASRK